MFGAVLVNNSLTISLIRFCSQQDVGYLDNDLSFAVRAQAFYTGVFILHTEDMPIWAFDLNSHDQSLSSASLNFANRGDDSQAKNLPKASGLKQPARRHFWVPQNSVAEVLRVNSIGSGQSQRKFLSRRCRSRESN
jgi:hypothetical protein